MPAPAQYTYASSAVFAANSAFLGLIDAGSVGGKIELYDDSDVLLAEVLLGTGNAQPSGTVNGSTGVLTLTIAGPDTAANATGTCTYGVIKDDAGAVLLSIPTVAGSTPVSGYLVLNSLSIVAGSQVTVVSAVIGG